VEKGKYYKSLETGKMLELGNVQYAVQDIRALKPPRNELSVPAQKIAPKTVVNDSAASAVINSWRAQDVTSTSDNPAFFVYSEASEYVKWLRREIGAINAYEGFLLGIHDKIEKFKKQTQFTLEQILDVEKHKAKLYESLELYKFTIRRIRADALKALRCQGNLGPQRALLLLKDTIRKLNAAEQTK